MSQHLEHDSRAKKPSHEELEHTSDLDSESEEVSTASEEDTFLSIQYPSPPFLPTPYLHNWDFLNSERALKYLMKHFNLKTIHDAALISQKTQSTIAPSSTQIVSTISKDISIKQFETTMPTFKIGQIILPDMLCLMILTTHSRKWNIMIQDPMEYLDDNALDTQYFFALPNTLDDHDIV